MAQSRHLSQCLAIHSIMQLHNINKQVYSKHYRILFWGIVAILLTVSLLTSSLLIQFFGTHLENNFWLNVAGVIAAALVVGGAILQFKQHPFMYEVVYVWHLKQILNKIYRKQRKITPLMNAGDINALVIMNFYYQGSKQLYELDNNTITMEELNTSIQHLEHLLAELKVNVSLEQFKPVLLDDI